MFQREIVGEADGKCVCVEAMPNNGKMECKYSPQQRAAAAQYYRDMLSYQNMKMNITASTGPDGKTKTVYEVDGKKIDNPLQDYMDDGTCVISGYGQ